jgi:hypothetical protein
MKINTNRDVESAISLLQTELTKINRQLSGALFDPLLYYRKREVDAELEKLRQVTLSNIDSTYSDNGRVIHQLIHIFTKSVQILGALTVSATTTAQQINPSTDLTYSLGTAALRWLKGFFGTIRLDSLTAGRILRLDGSKDTTTGTVDLSVSTDVSGPGFGTSVPLYWTGSAVGTALINLADSANKVTGTLPLGSGGTGQITANAARTAICQGLSVTVTLAKLTTLGSNGSITFTDGVLTSKVDPT